MTVRTIDDIFRDFTIDGVPASGPFNPHKPDIRDTLKALTEGSENFPDNRVIRLNNANEGTANNIVVTASVAIPAAAYQVLYILNVTQENTGPVTISGAINRDLVTNVNQPVPAGYLMPGMALLCIDTGTELRLLSYGDAEAILAAAEAAADRAEAAASGLNLPTIQPGDAGKALIVNESENGYELGAISAGMFDSNIDVTTAVIPTTANFLQTAGYYAAGDGGGALYKRVISEPSHSGKVKSADGAWWEQVFNENIIYELGGKLDGSADVSSAINTALAQKKRVTLPVGKFRLNSRILVDNSTMSGETETGPQGISFSGEDARQTVLMPTSGIGFPALTLRYGLGTAAHAQHKFSDFAIVGVGDQSCLRIENASMLRASNLSLRGGTTGLHLVSVLGSSFRDIRCDSNLNGVVVEKGSGFSYTNAIEFSNLNVGANTSVGFVSQDAVHNLTFTGGSVEGNGTQGVAGAGGMLLNFNGGIEGAVGANIIGMYFENNGGGFDLRLVNSGSEYVTVNVIGCNFNRTDPNKYVTTNIFCSGRINLVLIGCGFKGYGSYVETSGRLYVNHDGLARISGFGNKFTSDAAATGMQAFGNTARYRGAVASGGAALRLPLGWTSAPDVTGVTTVTHNLGLTDTNSYSVQATCTDGAACRVQRVSKNANNFQVVTENSGGALTNAKFDFEVSIE